MFFRRYWDYTILALIVLLAAAIRLYHFHDWLFFAMDQARDAFVAMRAFGAGPASLPLLGPRAAGTFLRLGPVFYYFQYLAAKISGSVEPSVFAYPDLIFSLLAIPLFFFFLRIYFSRIVSALATAVFAFSFVAVQYSRFAWNPNSVPFWTLVSLYGLYRFSVAEDRKKYRWLAISMAGLGIASQLHFLTFLSLPIIVLFYLFLTKSFSRAGWKGLLIAVIILGLLYFPMILSEIKTKGDNIGQFLFAIGSKPQKQSLGAGLFQNIKMHGQYYFLFLSSYTSRSFWPSVIAGIIFILLAMIYAGLAYFKEKDRGRKNFLALILAWISITFLILIPFSFQLQPRFFFIALALPFILFAFWLDGLFRILRRKYLALAVSLVITLALVGLNTEGVWTWYRALAKNEKPHAVRGRVLDIKQSANLGFTLSQIEEASDFLYNEWREKQHKIYISANMSYRVPIQYILEKKNPPADYGITGRHDQDRSVSYFSIRLSNPGMDPVSRRLRDKFDIIARHSFGKLIVYELELKEIQPKAKTKEEVDKTKQQDKERARRTDRVFWGDIFE